MTHPVACTDQLAPVFAGTGPVVTGQEPSVAAELGDVASDHGEVHAYLVPGDYRRLRVEALARGVSLSRCAGDYLTEYFALRQEMATAFETLGRGETLTPPRVIHVLPAQTEQRLVATLERYGEDLMAVRGELAAVLAMLDRSQFTSMCYTPEVPPDTRDRATTLEMSEGAVIDWREHLRNDPKVRGGQLCANGTRVLVTVILDNLAEGLDREEILRSYPTLELIHIDAALAWAACVDLLEGYGPKPLGQMGAPTPLVASGRRGLHPQDQHLLERLPETQPG